MHSYIGNPHNLTAIKGPHISPFPTLDDVVAAGTVQHRVLTKILNPSAMQQQEIIFELYILFRARAALFKSHRDKRFEYLVREVDNRARGWVAHESEMPKEHERRKSGIKHHDFPSPTILDLVCMYYIIS